jgi:hypothetical protein
MIRSLVFAILIQLPLHLEAAAPNGPFDCRESVRSMKDLGLKAEGLFTAIYRWRLKPGKEDDFRKGWAGLTRLIYERLGSFGSRLHKAEDGTWYAYAQWPSKELWSQVDLSDESAKHYRKLMRDAVEEDFPDILLTVTDDLLADPRSR